MTSPVAVVTGGSKGIGRAIALLLAKSGVKVCASYSSDKVAAEELAELLWQIASDSVVMRSDVADSTDREFLVKQVLSRWNRIDILVNAAGVNRRATFFNVSPDDWDKIYRTNVFGLYFMCQAVARTMLSEREGRIVNISSIASSYALGDRSVYESSKAAVDRITRSLAYELAPAGIKVNAVAPGLVETAMTRRGDVEDITSRTQHIPVGRTGLAEEVADVVRYFALEAPNYVTGTVLPVDGGRLTH
jgi:3-oxoacyl-[acyl-carrier protein] reductase